MIDRLLANLPSYRIYYILLNFTYVNHRLSTGVCMFVAQKYALIKKKLIKPTTFFRLYKSTSHTLDTIISVKLNYFKLTYISMLEYILVILTVQRLVYSIYVTQLSAVL